MHQCSKIWASRTVEVGVGLPLQLPWEEVLEEASLPSFVLRLLVGEAELSQESSQGVEVAVEAGVVQMQVVEVDQDK